MRTKRPGVVVVGVLAAILAAGGTVGFTARAEGRPAGVANPVRDLAVLERKLHGVWRGEGPCDGGLTLKGDGTYEWRLHGPGGNTSAGTWSVRWDALPPTLVLSCKTSDDPVYVRTTEVRLVRLDGESLAFTYPSGQKTPARYTRVKVAPVAPARARRASPSVDRRPFSRPKSGRRTLRTRRAPG